MITGNEPAMPLTYQEEYGDHGQKQNFVLSGLTIRQYFAAKALQGILASTVYEGWISEDLVAKKCCLYADALITELNKQS